MNNADKQCNFFRTYIKFVEQCNKCCNQELRMSIVHLMNGRNNRTVECRMKSNCKRSCFDFVNQHRHTDFDEMIWKMCDEWYCFTETNVKHTTIIHKLSKNFCLCFKIFVELSSNKIESNQLPLQYTSFNLSPSNQNLYGRKLWVPKSVSFETSCKM